ncbi:hypothetical protein [Solibacillus daqui]|uniref:hypothetical protein n=1 Tax=Solibacillus daqui TaxID=2912187 RepID=UPI0023670F7B|nr:hypothetical protein [Solibacillus daqui]
MSQSHLEVKINTLQKQTKSYLREIKEHIEKLPKSQNINIISYFTSSLNISHKLEQESICLGSYHIYNIGNEPILNPYISIIIPENSPFSFTGRYVREEFSQSFKGPIDWIRLANSTNKNEFLLKPLSKMELKPNEIISFSNFQIKWLPNESYSGSITGFTYCDQFQDGIAAVNPINLSVISLGQEE